MSFFSHVPYASASPEFNSFKGDVNSILAYHKMNATQSIIQGISPYLLPTWNSFQKITFPTSNDMTAHNQCAPHDYNY